MFIGRETELKFLNDKNEEKGGQLIVLYGRRRVGKTETLREFCKGKPHVFFSCTQTTDRVQLRNFSNRMLRENIPAKNYISEFEDWEKAFRAILDLPYGDAKKLIVIDEFPYMCRKAASAMRRHSPSGSERRQMACGSGRRATYCPKRSSFSKSPVSISS